MLLAQQHPFENVLKLALDLQNYMISGGIESQQSWAIPQYIVFELLEKASVLAMSVVSSGPYDGLTEAETILFENTVMRAGDEAYYEQVEVLVKEGIVDMETILPIAESARARAADLKMGEKEAFLKERRSVQSDETDPRKRRYPVLDHSTQKACNEDHYHASGGTGRSILPGPDPNPESSNISSINNAFHLVKHFDPNRIICPEINDDGNMDSSGSSGSLLDPQ